MTAAEYRAKRLALGYTQEQLAAQLGVHAQTIAKRERGAADAPITREAELAIAALATAPRRKK